MIDFLLHYLIVFVVFFAVDLVWLGVIARKLYAKYLGAFMSSKINWMAALIFYLIFIIGLLVFVIEPALDNVNYLTLAMTAALFGLVTYATYDLTNLATLKDWPRIITVIDLVWGISLSTIVSLVSVTVILAF